MTKFYRNEIDLPKEYLNWKDKIVTLPDIRKNCIGYFYLLTMIVLAAENPYASLHDLYRIGIEKKMFCTQGECISPSYSSIYAGISYALKDVPDKHRPETLKKYIYKAAMDLQLLTAQ